MVIFSLDRSSRRSHLLKTLKLINFSLKQINVRVSFQTRGTHPFICMQLVDFYSVTSSEHTTFSGQRKNVNIRELQYKINTKRDSRGQLIHYQNKNGGSFLSNRRKKPDFKLKFSVFPLWKAR